MMARGKLSRHSKKVHDNVHHLYQHIRFMLSDAHLRLLNALGLQHTIPHCGVPLDLYEENGQG